MHGDMDQKERDVIMRQRGILCNEMEKLAEVYDNIREARKTEKYVDDIVPLFITVDPDRDSVRIISTHTFIINGL